MTAFWASLPPIVAVLCLASAQLHGAERRYRAVAAFPRLSFESPVFITAAPGAGRGQDRLCVVEQDGFVRCFDNRREAGETRLALDLSKKVRRVHNEEGLLGLAFHPAATAGGRAYVYYSASHPRRNVLAEFTVDLSSLRFDPVSEKVLLEIEKPFGNHNGGMLAFGVGLDRANLYVSVGDGGSAGDPHDNGQDLSSLLGKILRIRVGPSPGGRPYGIPADNPFVKTPGARPEVFALGLRNVWRFSFDRETGALWAGDVGQDLWEEINLVPRGGNHGWSVREGRHPFKDAAPSTRPLVEPVFEYGREEGQSVTGGYVYRGRKLPELTGAYVYGDFMSGRIWALRIDGKKAVRNEWIAQGELISSFGEDASGELYFTSFDGKIYTLAR